MNRFLAISILVIGASTMAFASKVSDRAHAVIRLKVAPDGYNSVDFNTTKESKLSGDEVRVYGNAIASNKKTRETRPFDYSIIVNAANMQARQVEVRYRGGSEKPTKPQTDGGTGALNFSAPRANQTLSSTQVEFRGRATGKGNVTVTVYDERDKKVAEKTTMPSKKEWEVDIYLKKEGRFRAVASHDRRETEVRFRVDKDGNWENGDDWGSGGGNSNDWNSHDIQINTPSDGGQVSGSRIRFAGSALRTSRVRVRVYRAGGGGALFNENRSVRSGRWECEVPLARGAYRIQVTADGDDRDLGKMISFTVR